MSKIFLDPGHGGSDSGAVGNGILEKNINLTAALECADKLQKLGLQVLMSRTTDVDVSLDERCKMANDWNADYFISIHHNAGGGDGYEIIHSIYVGKGTDLANAIGIEFDKLGQNKRSIYSKANSAGNADYYEVIRDTLMSSIITEYAFVDNATDFQAIDTDAKLLAEGDVIATGVANYLGINTSAPVDQISAIVDSLVQKGLVNSPSYWKNNLQTGMLIKGEYVASILQKMKQEKII